MDDAVAAFIAYVGHLEADSPDDAAAAIRTLPDTISDGALRHLFDRLIVFAEERAAHGEHSGVYEAGVDAFEVFIRTGGNVGLYKAVAAALAGNWPKFHGWNMLEIGTGTGLGLIPALQQTAAIRRPAALELLEPSESMLAPTLAALQALDAPLLSRHHFTTLQQYIRDLGPLASYISWHTVQSTFALHNLRPPERRAALRWLASRCSNIMLVEFDVPALMSRESGDGLLAPSRVALALQSFSKGVAEYMGEAEGTLVIDGFLIPILLGYFSATSRSSTYEQPIDAWVRDLTEAGFTQVRKEMLFPYWSSDAWLVMAEGTLE